MHKTRPHNSVFAPPAMASAALPLPGRSPIGQNLDYLRSALIQYQTGARDVAAMRAAVGMLNAAQLDGLLQWYSGQSPATP
jgi:cytochrome c553